MQGMNKKNRNSEFSYLLEVTQRVSRKTGSGNKVVTSSLFLSLASLGGKCLTGFNWSSNYFHSYEKKTNFLHLPVFQHYLYQTAMEPLLESSSLQIGPSSSEMVAQDYELIVISGNCERRMLQRTWRTCVLCKKALMLTEVWVFHQTIWPGWLKSWRAQIQEGKSGRTKKGTICYCYQTEESQQETILFFICNSTNKHVICG